LGELNGPESRTTGVAFGLPFPYTPRLSSGREHHRMFEGSHVAVVTPFKDGAVDYDKLAEFIEWHVASGTDGIIPVGTTGESATLTHEEHHEVVAFTIRTVNKRMKVIAGAGSNATHEAISLARSAEKAGADAILSISPYYNKPTQEGIYLHFKAVAEATALPIVIYNVPGRTGREIAVETAARCAEIANIAAIKEAGGSVDRVSQLVRLDGLEVLSGDDSLTLPMMAVGALGVISVAANVVPLDMSRLVHACLAGKYDEARELHHRMFPLMVELFRENNPMGAKTALKLMGKLNGEVRLPLCDLAPANEQRLVGVLKEYGLVS
jgi:4-hydroxy-tetrahydrodipicolinate synthase